MVVAAKSKLREDRAAVKAAEKAVRIADEQAQRHDDRLEVAEAR